MKDILEFLKAEIDKNGKLVSLEEGFDAENFDSKDVAFKAGLEEGRAKLLMEVTLKFAVEIMEHMKEDE